MTAVEHSQIVTMLDNEINSLRQQIARIEEAKAALNGANHSKPKRVLSTAARRSIAQAQKQRWARWKKQNKQ